MTGFSVSKAARSDLKAIAFYTQRSWGASQRRAYMKGLDEAFHFLAQNSGAGIPCDYLIGGLRAYRHQSHIIFYECRDNAVFIARVLHRSMQAGPRFNHA